MNKTDDQTTEPLDPHTTILSVHDYKDDMKVEVNGEQQGRCMIIRSPIPEENDRQEYHKKVGVQYQK